MYAIKLGMVGLGRMGANMGLASRRSGKLKIVTTPNQDNPLTRGLSPIMGNDGSTPTI